jgi:alpha-aminoadipic semialdehyde synthase
MFFSHTHKGQPYNMEMLKNILDKKIRLIDYELLKDEKSKRLVQFSSFAGYAGMMDGLHALARRLLALGYGTPFSAIGMSCIFLFN